MSLSSLSSSSSMEYSADKSGYVTVRLRSNPSHTNTNLEREITSERRQNNQLEASPASALPQLASTNPGTNLDTPVVQVVPIGCLLGINREEAQCMHAMSLDIHDCGARVLQQGQSLTGLVELTDLVYECSTRAWEKVNAARKTARRVEVVCLMASVMVTALVLLVLILACLC